MLFCVVDFAKFVFSTVLTATQFVFFRFVLFLRVCDCAVFFPSVFDCAEFAFSIGLAGT